jgi:glycosyltransferase involved in cell wall biosynthesis
MKLSIIIPAHNEEHRLPPMLEAYTRYFTEKYRDEVELIVVPNFCNDKTADIARTIGKNSPQVKVLDDPGKVGKGGAVMLGAEAAAGDLIGFVDADGATPPEAFDDLVSKMGTTGCIIASRWLKESTVSPRQPLARRVMSRCFNTFVRLLFGLKLTDTQCGAKVFRKEAMQTILPRLGLTRWAFDVDMLFQTKRAGYSIRELPTVWHDQAGSKIQYLGASVDMVMALVRLRLLHSPLRWTVHIYNTMTKKLGWDYPNRH